MTDKPLMLLRIREHRERLARSRVFEAQRKLEECINALKEQSRQFDAFREFRTHTEHEMFIAMLGKPVASSKISDFRHTLDKLKLQQLRLEADLKTAYHNLESAQRELQARQKTLARANQDLEKLSELFKEMDTETRKNDLLIEEAELDETVMTSWVTMNRAAFK
ncbi:MAG: YscO family type III secretion system apparatus protein [Thiotrichales bacterium]